MQFQFLLIVRYSSQCFHNEEASLREPNNLHFLWVLLEKWWKVLLKTEVALTSSAAAFFCFSSFSTFLSLGSQCWQAILLFSLSLMTWTINLAEYMKIKNTRIYIFRLRGRLRKQLVSTNVPTQIQRAFRVLRTIFARLGDCHRILQMAFSFTIQFQVIRPKYFLQVQSIIRLYSCRQDLHSNKQGSLQFSLWIA